MLRHVAKQTVLVFIHLADEAAKFHRKSTACTNMHLPAVYNSCLIPLTSKQKQSWQLFLLRKQQGWKKWKKDSMAQKKLAN